MTCRCGNTLHNVAIPSKNIVCPDCFRDGLAGYVAGLNSYRDLPRLRQVALVDGFSSAVGVAERAAA